MKKQKMDKLQDIKNLLEIRTNEIENSINKKLESELKKSENKIIKFLISTYTWIFRGTPLMLQLLMVYYGLPLIKIKGYSITLTAYMAVAITFVINYAAYLIEIIRSGLESIDKGQHEAAKVLGYTYWQKIIYIIWSTFGTLPQCMWYKKHRKSNL